MRIQLWSYNYAPEPTGIAPLSATWAKAMRARGHDVEVVAAHPHYPEPIWGHPLWPHREVRDGVPVLRLPLWPGRDTTVARLRQEASFTAALAASLPALGRPDVLVAVSPCFPALLPAMVQARLRGIPWVLWLQDILPDGATRTGMLDDGTVIRLSRRLETAAYRSAERIFVISETFADNLLAKGVAPAKLTRIYNPASRPVRTDRRDPMAINPKRVLTMGNIGYSQALVETVRAFEADRGLAELRAELVLAGDGLLGDEVRAAITTERVWVTGILDDQALGHELARAAVALVSQRYEGGDFNVPSKLMNFLGGGLPVVASVGPGSEVASIIARSEAGYVTDSRDPAKAAAKLAEVLRRPDELAERGRAGLAFAQAHLTAATVADTFERDLAALTKGRARP